MKTTRLAKHVWLSLVLVGSLSTTAITQASFFTPIEGSELVQQANTPVEVSFYEADHRKRKTYKVMRAAQTIQFGANPQRFVDVPVIELTHHKTGAKGKYQIIADSEGLYISGVVDDKRLNTHYRDKLWMDDSIELMLDVGNNGGRFLEYDDYKFLVNLVNIQYSSQAGNSAWEGVFDSTVDYNGSLNNNRDTDEGYLVETKIPWSTLGLNSTPDAGTVFGFELGLNDSIAKGKYRWYRQRFWSNADGGSANNPSGWGALIFSNEVIDISPELTFEQSNTVVYPGGDVKLSWASIRTGYCTASGNWEGEMPLKGMETISDITEDMTFTLTCGGYGGVVEKTLSVKVLPVHEPDAIFSVDKVVSVDGVDFNNDIELKNGEKAYYRVIIKNEGQVAGDIQLLDELTIPTNGGALSKVTGMEMTCPPRAECTGTLTDGGVFITSLEPEESVVLEYNRTASSLGIPSDDHSIIVDTANLAGNLGASTSGVTIIANYPVIQEDVCPDADFVVPADMWVVGDGCHNSGRTSDDASFMLDVAGNYDIDAYVVRSESGKCNTQTNESFTLDVNNSTGVTVEDDTDECTISSRNQFAGTYELFTGKNTVTMNTASQCPPDNSANSVKVTHLCLNRIPDQYEVPSLMHPFDVDGHYNEFEDSEFIDLGDDDHGLSAAFRFVSTEDALHMIAEVKDPQLNALAEGRDEDLFQDDAVAIMLDLDADLGSEPQNNDYRYFVNLNNAKADSDGGDFYYDSDFESVVRYNGTLNDNTDNDIGYSIEMKIPWEAIGYDMEPAMGTAFGFEVVFNDIDADGNKLQYAWSNASGGTVHDPNGWGELLFLGKSLSEAPQITFTASASSVEPLGSVELKWETENADYCLALDDWQNEKPTNGIETIEQIDGTKGFTLVCGNEYETVVKSVYVATSEFAPQLTLNVDATTVEEGDSVELSWVSFNTLACAASGNWYGEKTINDSEKIRNIRSNQAFTLTCVGPYGTVTRTAEVAVSSSAPMLDFAASATAVQVGNSVELTWNTTNATNCVASGDWEGDKNLAGSEIIENIDEEKSFTLTCSENTGTVSETIHVKLSSSAPSLEFIANKNAIKKGDEVNLKWSTSDASECIASGDWEGIRSVHGTEVIADIQKEKSFTLTCSGNIMWDGLNPVVETVSKTIKVAIATTVPTLNFTADKVEVAEGGSATLQWTAQNADICVPSGDWGNTEGPYYYDEAITNHLAGSTSGSSIWFETLPPVGSREITDIVADKTFHLTCYSRTGAVSETVEIQVTDGPIAPPPTNPPGSPSFSCHKITQADPALVPSRFGYPWNMFSEAREITSKVKCLKNAIEIVIGTGEDNHFIWHSGYLTKDGKTWEQIKYESDVATANGKWIAGTATTIEAITPEQMTIPNYLVSYTCSLVNNEWKCGCREAETCTGSGKWTFQYFENSLPHPPPTPTDPPGLDETIVAIAAENSDFSTLFTALEAADLVNTLNGEGPFTVFAPTNAAFAKLPTGALDLLLAPENVAILTDILAYHVTPAAIGSNDIPLGVQYEMANGETVSFSVSQAGDRFFINNAEITITDIQASNGIIHVIDKVLLPVHNYELNGLLQVL